MTLTALWTLLARSPIRFCRVHNVAIRIANSARQKKESSPDQKEVVVARRAAQVGPAVADFEPTAEHAVVAVAGSFPVGLQAAAEVSVAGVAPAAAGAA